LSGVFGAPLQHYPQISFGYESINNYKNSFKGGLKLEATPALSYIFHCLKTAIKGCRCDQG
jgi:hypothetical protein